MLLSTSMILTLIRRENSHFWVLFVDVTIRFPAVSMLRASRGSFANTIADSVKSLMHPLRSARNTQLQPLLQPRRFTSITTNRQTHWGNSIGNSPRLAVACSLWRGNFQRYGNEVHNFTLCNTTCMEHSDYALKNNTFSLTLPLPLHVPPYYWNSPQSCYTSTWLIMPSYSLL